MAWFCDQHHFYDVLLSTSRTGGLQFLPTTRVLPGLFPLVALRSILQSVALSISRFCFSHGIVLEAQWIPRSFNDRADLLSQFVDKDDWQVNPSVFRLVDAKWGPHTIDRFASYYNAQLPRFNSKFASPGCSGVDALVQDWNGENNWVCPPVGLIVGAVQVLTACSVGL